ncbi:MAG: helix-turn-helix domain-containing protein [Nanoarchaeota archaeon]
MDIHELSKIGLTEGEIKVYSALLTLGECTKSALAKESGVAPSNIYDITNRLTEKGIISTATINGVAHFSAADPTHLLSFIEQKEKDIQTQKEVAETIIPHLLAQYHDTARADGIQIFKGWSGLKTVFDDMLTECAQEDTCHVFGANKGSDKSARTADTFFAKYSRMRAHKGIQTSIICNEDLRESTRFEFMRSSPHYTIKYLEQNTLAEIMIYQQTSCIIILTDEPICIRIRGAAAQSSFSQYFQILWAQAKP